ncbi:MAG: hypothetical protein ACJ8F1_19290 [Polyangia bacterium]
MMVGVLVLGGVATTGCEDKHIGRPCELGADAGTTGASGGPIAIISSPVLACPSRICLLPGGSAGSAPPNGLGDAPTCTATCSTDKDCNDAETTSDPNDPAGHCKSHFVCMVPTTSGPFCCQKFCVCDDFVTEPPNGFPTPTACEPSTTTCKNVM